MAPMGARTETEYVTPADLRLGSSVSIHGRTFWLYDCDAFTRQYCQVRQITLNVDACIVLMWPVIKSCTQVSCPQRGIHDRKQEQQADGSERCQYKSAHEIRRCREVGTLLL